MRLISTLILTCYFGCLCFQDCNNGMQKFSDIGPMKIAPNADRNDIRLRKSSRNILSKNDEKDNDKLRNEMWDDWGNWSTCSITCGDGHQVRWRHCVSDVCVKGLKKAQIRTCRLKNCDSKNLLNWLGIKPAP